MWTSPNIKAFLSFSFKLSLSLPLLPVVLEVFMPDWTCYSCHQSLSPGFFDSLQVLLSWVQSEVTNQVNLKLKTLNLFQAAANFDMASPVILSCKSIDPREDYLIDLDAFIRETNLTFGPLNHTKQLLMDNSNVISQTFCSNISQSALEPTFPYPELIHWAVSNFVPSTKQVISYDGSKIIVSINSKAIQKPCVSHQPLQRLSSSLKKVVWPSLRP